MTTPLQDRFALALLDCRTTVEAYRLAYQPSPDAKPTSIHTAAWRAKKNPRVRARYEQLLSQRVAAIPTVEQLTPETAREVLAELQRLAKSESDEPMENS